MAHHHQASVLLPIAPKPELVSQTLTFTLQHHSQCNHHDKQLSSIWKVTLLILRHVANPAQLVFAGKGDPSTVAVPTALHQQHSRYHHHECYLNSIFKKAQVAGYSWLCRCDH